jgi:hypothetical protein
MPGPRRPDLDANSPQPLLPPEPLGPVEVPDSPQLKLLASLRKLIGWSGWLFGFGLLVVFFGWPLGSSRRPLFLLLWLPAIAGLAGMVLFSIVYYLVVFFCFTRYSLRTMLFFILAGGTCVSLIVAAGPPLGSLGISLLVVLALFLFLLVTLYDPLIKPRRPKSKEPEDAPEPPREGRPRDG